MRTTRVGLMMGFWLGMTFAMVTAVSAAPTVYVVNYPLQYFTQRIAGNHVQVVFPAPPDEDPAFWKPDVKPFRPFKPLI